MADRGEGPQLAGLPPHEVTPEGVRVRGCDGLRGGGRAISAIATLSIQLPNGRGESLQGIVNEFSARLLHGLLDVVQHLDQSGQLTGHSLQGTYVRTYVHSEDGT